MNASALFTQFSKNLKKSRRKFGRLARRFIKAVPEQPALVPGSLVYQGEARTEPVHFTVIDYDADHHEQKEFQSAEECFPYKDKATTSWINVSGVHEIKVIEALGKHFALHPLVMEDIVHTNQRPKLEDHEDYIYLVLKMLRFGAETSEVESEQVSLLLGQGWVVTFQEKNGDVFGPVRDRARSAQGRIRKFGADYLAYTLVDAIVDHYFVVLEKIGDQIEALEEVVQQHPASEVLQQIHHLKREMIYMRKSIWPLREVINQLYKDELPLIQDNTRLYLRDVYDHTIQIIETVESFRDMLSGVQDLYLSVISNRMNEVMKVLTVIATIFIPPTFVAGVYGMNFENMPELHTPFGYFAALGVMGLSIFGMLLFFRRKKWL